MAEDEKNPPNNWRAHVMRLFKSFGKSAGAEPPKAIDRLRQMREHEWRGDLKKEEPVSADSKAKVVPPAAPTVRAKANEHTAPEVCFDPGAEVHSVKPELSQSAQEELIRIELAKRDQIARSVGNFLTEVDYSTPDSVLVEQWKVSGTSFLNVTSTQELSPVERVVARSAPDPEPIAKAAPELAEPALPEPPAASVTSKKNRHGFNVPQNPYRDYSETALMLLAQNPTTTKPALTWLSLHSNADIRSAVARNPNCSPDTLSLLARDGEAGIRHAIADNPKCSIGILEQLAIDKNPLIAWRAQNSLNVARGRRTVTDMKPAHIKSVTRQQALSRTGSHLPFSSEMASTEETINFLGLIARKSSTPMRRLAELARHPDARVRAAVAENANSPPELIWLLAKDEAIEVKLKVTENYNCPIEVLEALKDDNDSYVAWQARSVLHRLMNPGQPNPYMDNSNNNSNNPGTNSSTTHLRIVTSRDLP